jgi:hypothetical protein
MVESLERLDVRAVRGLPWLQTAGGARLDGG